MKSFLYAMPAVLVADAARDGEVQLATAAEEAGVALALELTQLTELPQMLQALWNDVARTHLHEASQEHPLNNGAEEIASQPCPFDGERRVTPPDGRR